MVEKGLAFLFAQCASARVALPVAVLIALASCSLTPEPEPAPTTGLVPAPIWAPSVGEFVEVGPTAVYEVPVAGERPFETTDVRIRALVVATLGSPDGAWLRIQYLWDRSSAVFGWIRIASKDDPLVRNASVRCPRAELTLLDLGGLTPPERLHCFGDRIITLNGVEVQPRVIQPRVVGTPAWLATDPAFELAWPGSGRVGIHSPDAFGTTALRELGQVTAHFDDPVSATCVRARLDSLPDETLDEQRLACRQHLVLDRFEPAEG